MRISIGVIMALAWLLIVGCTAHLLTERIADAMDVSANAIANS